MAIQVAVLTGLHFDAQYVVNPLHINISRLVLNKKAGIFRKAHEPVGWGPVISKYKIPTPVIVTIASNVDVKNTSTPKITGCFLSIL